MASSYSTEEGGVSRAARRKPVDQGAKQETIVVRRTFNLTGQTTADDLRMTLPEGFRPCALRMVPSVTLGTSTLAVGVSGTAGKYRAAAALTAPSLAPLPLGAEAKLTAPEDVIITIGTATLPVGGTLVVEFQGTKD